MMFGTWENLGEYYAKDPQVGIAEMNCKSKDLKVCRSMKVDRYPTFILFKNGKKQLKLKGGQRKSDFIEYVEDLRKESKVLRDET
jgi:predicted DsbA family dithiol-disulfide isomerase